MEIFDDFPEILGSEIFYKACRVFRAQELEKSAKIIATGKIFLFEASFLLKIDVCCNGKIFLDPNC